MLFHYFTLPYAYLSTSFTYFRHYENLLDKHTSQCKILIVPEEGLQKHLFYIASVSAFLFLQYNERGLLCQKIITHLFRGDGGVSISYSTMNQLGWLWHVLSSGFDRFVITPGKGAQGARALPSQPRSQALSWYLSWLLEERPLLRLVMWPFITWVVKICWAGGVAECLVCCCDKFCGFQNLQ